MAEDIRTLSAVLARDPASLVYAELAEALRRRGQRDEALRIAEFGLGRHPQHADGHDCLARIYADLGDLPRARATWERALEIAPEHSGALKGIGFLFYRQGDLKRAADALEHALAVNPADEAARRALEAIRGGTTPWAAAAAQRVVAGEAAPLPEMPSREGEATRSPEASEGALRAVRPSEPRGTAEPTSAEHERAQVFVGLEGATADILLLDARGLVVAGGLKDRHGADVSELAAAALAGVSGEASRTVGYLGLGAWGSIVAEADTANLVLAPVGEGALLMARRDRSIPVGLALRFAERARGAAHRWLEGQGA